MLCHQKWDSAFWHGYGTAQGGHLFFIWSNLWLCGLRHAPGITWFTVMAYRPVLLSDKVSSSHLLPFLTLQLLTRESEHVFPLALTSPVRPSTHNYCAMKQDVMLGKTVNWIFLGPYSLYAVHSCLKNLDFFWQKFWQNMESHELIKPVLLVYMLYLRKSKVQKTIHKLFK